MERCYIVQASKGLVEVEFMGIYQETNIVGPSIRVGGHSGGVGVEPVAVIKIYKDNVGTLSTCSFERLKFIKDVSE